MANEIIIQNAENPNLIRIFPLVEDVSLTATSSYFNPGSWFGGIENVIKMMNNVQSAAGGQVSGFTNFLQNVMDAKIHESTEPIKFSVKIAIYPGVNQYSVYQNFLWVFGHSVPSYENGSLYVPGLSMKQLNTLKPQKGQQKSAAVERKGNAKRKNSKSQELKEIKEVKSKLINIEIPGVVYLIYGMIESINATFSKEMDTDGYPIWCHLDTTFAGVRSAILNDFSEAQNKSVIKEDKTEVQSNIAVDQQLWKDW